ncbi:MAG: hypothetical protein ACRCVX_11960 [Shewanella sp.]
MISEEIQIKAKMVMESMTHGKSLRESCLEIGMSKSYFFVVKDSTPELKDQYARARELQAEALFEDLEEVAEEALKATTAIEVQARRLIVDTRKWRLSKIVPKRYGEKTEVTQEIKLEGTIEHQHIGLPETANWLAGIVGQPATRSPSEPGQN